MHPFERPLSRLIDSFEQLCPPPEDCHRRLSKVVDCLSFPILLICQLVKAELLRLQFFMLLFACHCRLVVLKLCLKGLIGNQDHHGTPSRL